MTHIMERFIIHFAASAFILSAFRFALLYWIRRNAKVSQWVSPNRRHMLVTCALLVAAILPLREPYDVWLGNQVWYKAIFDQLSWFSGAGAAAWGLWRFSKDDGEQRK